MKKAKLWLLAVLMVMCLVVSVACNLQLNPTPDPTHEPLDAAVLAVGENDVELYVEDGRAASFTASETGRYTISLKTASATATVAKVVGESTEAIQLPYTVRLDANEKLSLAISSTATTEKDSVTIVVEKVDPLANVTLQLGDNDVEWYVDEGRIASFTATAAGGYTFSAKNVSATTAVKKVVGTSLEDVTLPYTVRLAANDTVTFAFGSVATTEKDSTTMVVEKVDPLADVALELGDNNVDLFVDEGRTAVFTAAKDGRYEISLNADSDTVTFVNEKGTAVDLPLNTYLEKGQKVTLVLSSVATTEKDSVTLTIVEDTNNYVASIDVQNKLSPNKGEMSFITTEAYSNITEISFKAKTVTDNAERWWGISLATTQADADIYTMKLGTLPVTGGEWIQFTFKFEDGKCKITSNNGFEKTIDVDNKSYYIYFIGAKGEDFGGNILLDDFTIVADGETYVDDFQKGFDNGLFDADTTWVEGGVPVKEEIVNDIVIKDNNNYVAHINTRRHAESGASFVTKNAYEGITEISFKAKTADASNSWWGISLRESADKDIYNWALGTLPSTNGEWVQFTFTFADGVCTITSNQGFSVTKEVENKAYYVYLISAKGEFDYVEFDDFVIKTADGTYTEDFNKSIDKWLFDVEVQDEPTTSPVRKIIDNNVAINTNENHAASIDIKNLLQSDAGKQHSFVTKQAYSNITEISFKAKTGATASWWGISLTDVPAEKDIYYWNPSQVLPTTAGEWVTFTYTFADGKCTITSTAGLNETKDVENNNCYIFLFGERGGGDFSDNVLIDDFVIKTADGETYTENFEGDISKWLFATDVAVTRVAA